MKILTLTLFFAAAPLLYGEEPRQDLLSFANGDQLHGRLSGIAAGPSIQWKRDDVGLRNQLIVFLISESPTATASQAL